MKFLLTFFFLFLSTSVFADSCVSGDCVNGYGTYVWDDGTKYVGESKDNLLNGQGTMIWANGKKYVGEFKNNSANGQGTYNYPDGTTRKGIWKNGKFLTPN